MLDAIDNRTELRLQLLRNGYTPLLNIDKNIRLKRWNKLHVDEALIRSWARSRLQSTGLRVENGLVAIDGDIPNEQLAAQAWGLLPKRVLQRIGRAPKWMALARIAEPAPALMRSREWSDGENKLQIEIFTGNKQVGAFGWHTAGERKYQWLGKSPADVPLAQLPPVRLVKLRAICAAFDDLARQAGLTELAADKTPNGSRVFDITDETRFDDNEGRYGLDYGELEQHYWRARHEGRSYRVASPWTGDGRNTDKCWVFKHEACSCIAVYDHRSGSIHLPAGAGASMISEELANMLNILTGGENS
jgi:hypothetical protein